MWWRNPSMMHIINFYLAFAGIWISEWHNIFEEVTNRESSRTSWDRWSLLDMKMVSGFANKIVLDIIFIYWRWAGFCDSQVPCDTWNLVALSDTTSWLKESFFGLRLIVNIFVRRMWSKMKYMISNVKQCGYMISIIKPLGVVLRSTIH